MLSAQVLGNIENDSSGPAVIYNSKIEIWHANYTHLSELDGHLARSIDTNLAGSSDIFSALLVKGMDALGLHTRGIHRIYLEHVCIPIILRDLKLIFILEPETLLFGRQFPVEK